MIPVVSIVGRKNAGKTTLVERVVRFLVDRGWRVGTLKHDVHGFEMDHEGKDTWRHWQAGAHRVVIAGPDEIACRERIPAPVPSEEVLARYFHDLDLVVTEGYRTGPWPKIEILRQARSPEPLCVGDETLIALATDLPGDWPVPAFPLDDPAPLGTFLEGRLLGSARRSG